MKLIIDIPKKEYEDIKELIAINIGGRCSGKGIIQTCLNAVKNGIPLDDVKAEIEDLDRFYDNDYFSGNRDSMFKCNEIMKILDNIGKAESEDKPDEPTSEA